MGKQITNTGFSDRVDNFQTLVWRSQASCYTVAFPTIFFIINVKITSLQLVILQLVKYFYYN